MNSLFLSYARDDDEPFVKRLRDDLRARKFEVWWDRASMSSRGQTFLHEIREAIHQCDRLVLSFFAGGIDHSVRLPQRARLAEHLDQIFDSRHPCVVSVEPLPGRPGLVRRQLVEETTRVETGLVPWAAARAADGACLAAAAHAVVNRCRVLQRGLHENAHPRVF